MLLSELFKGAPELEIEQLSIDSRLSMKNAIFFCLDGIKYDGHDYIEEAISNGAKVIVYSKDLETKYNAVYIKVNNVNTTLTRVANIFYDYPNDGVSEYVVCGNYGCCSVASFINHFLNKRISCGYVGILGIRYNGLELNSSFATLNILENLKLLDTMRKNGVEACTFEADASALNLQKLDSIEPDCVIYTCTDKNSSDFQSSDYYNSIRRYFYTLENTSKVILNIDDESFNELSDCIENYVTYGRSSIADYQIRDVQISRNGISYKIIYDEKAYNVASSLQGDVNVYNLTAAIAALHMNGYELEKIIADMQDVPYVEGVMERVDPDYNIIVDCAYDIGSIERLFAYADYVSSRSKVIGIVGINYSDGDKRISKLMELADKYLDVLILTENESYNSLVSEILNRCDPYVRNKRVTHVTMRSQAIENGIEILNSTDTLLIVGKGNERFLSMGLGKEFYYGDRHYARKFMKKRKEEENEII